jgi:hypothetical protein
MLMSMPTMRWGSSTHSLIVRRVVLKDNSGAQDASAEHLLGPRCLQYLVPD